MGMGEWECMENQSTGVKVGPRIFFSDSTALLLQLRDALECQQLAEVQNARQKTKIKRDRRKRGEDCV